MEYPVAAGLDVRLGAGAGKISRRRFDGIRKAVTHSCQGSGFAGDRLRRIWRGLCAHRAGGERAPYPPGSALCEEVSVDASQRKRRTGIRDVKTPLKIAIAGVGTVGGGVVKALTARREQLAERAERRLDVVAVSARDRGKSRAADISGFEWFDDPIALE